MKFIRNIIIPIFTFFLLFSMQAQKGLLRKANEEYDKYAYINAQKIYLEVLKEGYKSPDLYKKLGNTYYFNGDYNNAAVYYENLITEYPENIEPIYYFRGAQSLRSKGDEELADSLMNKYLAMSNQDSLAVNSTLRKTPEKDFTQPTFGVKKLKNINTRFSEFGSTFFNNKLVYASSSPDSTQKIRIHEWTQQPFLDLFQATIRPDGSLVKPEKLKGQINSPLHESTPTFTRDGKTVYFTRNNYIDGKRGKDRQENIRLKVYKASLVEGEWRDITELPFNNASYSVAHPTLNSKEDKLYFSSDMPGTLGASDLWYVEILGNNQYGLPINLGPTINTPERESFPYINNENKLYFATDGREGYGGLDIFYTQLNEGGLPGRLFHMNAPINGSMDDFAFLYDTNKKLAYFSSNRGAVGAEVMYDDIYLALPQCEVTLEGVVRDANIKTSLSEVQIVILNNNSEEINRTMTNEEGFYSFRLTCESYFSIIASKEKYEPEEVVINSPGESTKLLLDLELKLSGCADNDLGCRLALQPIFFDYDKWNIRPDAAIELAKIKKAMEEYPQLKIKIESHTDSRGDAGYNQRLSSQRANSTMNWLIEQGISSERLIAEGLGESNLLVSCDDDLCSEEEHQKNRRSVFLIIDNL